MLQRSMRTEAVRSVFHEGELAVQRRAGVGGEAAQLARMLGPAELHGGFARFLQARTFAALTARDGGGRLWISPLTGPAGFLEPTSPTTLQVHAAPLAGDPLERIAAGQPAGLLAIEFASRGRVRINGTLAAVGGGGLTIDVAQAYGNCPKYISPRVLERVPVAGEPVRHGSDLAAADIELIRRADTFLIGTTHPVRGNDASHRGGPPGFVQVDADGISWPDFPGNNLFNTLGNLEIDPTAALLFADFATGRTLQLSGRARVEWVADDVSDRRVRFVPEAVVAGPLLGVRSLEG
jgi:predicted pyridoxine 5'-phosphate oxidase superfamily flavin-nucleotide-binding protein